jgi:hypothetical protein
MQQIPPLRSSSSLPRVPQRALCSRVELDAVQHPVRVPGDIFQIPIVSASFYLYEGE